MTRFYISDLHFDHANILTFKDSDGNPTRPFKDLEEMQSIICHRWNSTVSNSDIVYVLGDVTMGKSTKCLSFLETLRGRKILIRGNHDIAKLSQYAMFFDDVRGYDVKPDFICSHIPIHPGSIARFKMNVHGHLHTNFVPHVPAKHIATELAWQDDGDDNVLSVIETKQIYDPRYLNVCVEQTNYTPISYDEILKIKKDRGIE